MNNIDRNNNYDFNIAEVNSFLIDLREKKELLEHTIIAYSKDLEIFFEKTNEKLYFEIDEKDIFNYIEAMRSDYTQNTVYRKLMSIKAFFKYLYLNHKIEKLITEKFKNIKQKNYIPEVLNEEEISSIMINCDNDERGKRDRLIILFLYKTGILISDLLQLKMEDIVDCRYIRYNSSKKSHLITLDNDLEKELKQYLEEVWKEFYQNDEKFIFPGLSRQNFAARLKKYAKNARINRNIYPNMFRNTLAVNLLDVGNNIRDIKERLNYVNISRAGIYNIRNKSHIKEIYDKIAIGDWNVSEDF